MVRMSSDSLEKFLNPNFSINANILWFILSIAIFFFIIASLMLFYHWHKFGKHVLAVGTSEVVYLAGAIFFLLGATASILLF